MFGDIFDAFEEDNIELANDVIKRKALSVKIENEIKKLHFSYLSQNYTQAVSSNTIFLDILNCYRVINSHIASIAYIIKGEF